MPDCVPFAFCFHSTQPLGRINGAQRWSGKQPAISSSQSHVSIVTSSFSGQPFHCSKPVALSRAERSKYIIYHPSQSYVSIVTSSFSGPAFSCSKPVALSRAEAQSIDHSGSVVVVDRLRLVSAEFGVLGGIEKVWKKGWCWFSGLS